MDAGLAEEPFKAGQVTYRRKAAAATEGRAAEVVASSSSPPRFPGSSSPFIRAVDDTGEMRERNTSCNTTVSSEDEHDAEEEEEEEQLKVKSYRRGGPKNAMLFLSDEDADEEADALKDGRYTVESDADFLKRFRASRADRAAVLAQQSSSNPEMASSSSLSDPPTLSNPSQQAKSIDTSLPSFEAMQMASSADRGDDDTRQNSPSSSAVVRGPVAARLAGSLESTSQSEHSPTPSPYVTEAHKRMAEDIKRLCREARVKELASRKAKANEMPTLEDTTTANVLPHDDDDDDVVESSASDDDDGETLPDAIKAARVASEKRRRAEEKKLAKQMASRKTNGATGGVLEMRVDDESDSDLEMPTKDAVKEKGRAMKPLSKKEEEEMHRMQAKIERESKVRQAKTLRKKSGEARPTFGLSDLLSNIDRHEKANGVQGRQLETEEALHEANNSDPIESSSDGDLDLIDTKKKGLTSVSRGTDRFGPPPIKPPTPSPPQDTIERADEDEELPDASDTRKEMLEERMKKSRMDAFKEKKMQALLKSIANQDKSAVQDDDEEDDLVLERNTTSKAMIQPKPRDGRGTHSINRMGSPLGFSDAESDEELVSDAQLKRAGMSLHAPLKKGVTKDVKIEGAAKGKVKEMTSEELNSALLRRAQLQNIEMRRKREAAFGRRKELQKPPADESPKEDVADMLRKLREAHEKRAEQDDIEDHSDGEGSEYRPDDAADEDAGEEIGSAEEEWAEEGEDQGSEEASSDAESNDSEKENSMPPSQEGVLPRMPRRSRIVMDEDDQESNSIESLVGRSPLQPILVGYEDDVLDGKGDAEEEEEEKAASPAIMNSSEGGFSQFFAETQVPAGPVATSTRKISSTLGKFFEDSQPDHPLRGESFHVLPSDNESDSLGFSQFFNEGTQQPVPQNTARLMLPPNTSAKGLALRGGTDEDGFAALRKAQASEAGALESEAGGLPSLNQAAGLGKDEVAALEMEALEAEAELRREQNKEKQIEEADVTYINKDGFFTQTRPDFDRYSLSQSQSQDRMERSSLGKHNAQGSSLSVDEPMPSSDGGAKKRRRFRRAVSIEENDAAEAMTAEVESVADERAATLNEEEQEGDDEEGAPLPNAFEVMKAAVKRVETAVDNNAHAPGQKRSRFIQGEAEESDDEEEGHAGKKQKAGRGGLGGVFSDDESDNDVDEEEDEEDDGRDLEELIDEEKDEEEAEKDVLARERYLKDIEADDQAALALHEKATRGGLRSKRRAVNLDGTMEGFLDDDFEDEWLEKKVKNPYGYVPKKRRLQGLDGLDLLEANEESQAFVRRYRETHEKETNLDKYGFLMPEDEDEEQLAENDELVSGGESKRADDMHLEDESEEEGESDHVQTMSHQQLRQELEERRRRRKRQALEDDEDLREEAQAREQEEAQEAEEALRRAEEEARMMRKLERDIFGHSSDEDDDEEDTTANVRDRIRGLADRKIASGAGKRGGDDDEEEDAESAFSALNRIANVRTLSELEQQRLAQLQSEFANEPEWGNHDANQHANYKRNSSSSGGSITSFKASKGVSSKSSNPDLNGARSTRGDHRTVTSKLHRVRSKLSDVMSRKQQFSEVHDT